MNNRSKFSPHIPVLILALLVAVLTSCVISPLYMQTKNDITVMYTFFPIILEYVIILFESLYIALLCSFVVYAVYGIHKGTETKAGSAVLTATVVFLKHALNLAVSSIIDGYIDLAFDIPVSLMLLCADLLLLGIVAYVANTKWNKHFDHLLKMQKAAKYIATVEYNEKGDLYPFKGFFNIKNPIIYSIFIGSLLTLIILVVQRIFADILLGFPTSLLQFLEIILAYAGDALLALAGYTAAYFSSAFIFIKEVSEEDNF